MNKNSEIAAIGFASAGHTLCHLLTLLFPTLLLVLEVNEFKFQGVGGISGPGSISFWCRCFTGRMAR